MELAEYPLLNTPNLAVVVLKTAAAGDASVDDALVHLRTVLGHAGADPAVDDAVLRNRLRAVGTYLANAGLIQFYSGSHLTITDAGLRAMSDCPDGFDTADLLKNAEIRRRIRELRRRASGLDAHSEQYARGFNAYRKGQRITENPFRQDSVDYLSWEDGWCEAHDMKLLSDT